MNYNLRFFCLFSLVFFVLTAQAHQSSTALLSFEQNGNQLDGVLHWQLYDLEQSLGLDRNRDGELYWGEVKNATADIQALVGRHLRVARDGQVCGADLSGPLQFNKNGGTQGAVVIPLSYLCGDRGVYEITYDGMFDILPEHRLLWSSVEAGVARQGVLTAPGTYAIGGSVSAATTFREFFVQGIIHIGLGPDHVAFLLTLLLVSVMVQNRKAWLPASDVRTCLKAAMVYVTTFTVAHSLTLSASALGWLSLPGYWVELIIAISVVVAALNNIRPFLPGSVLMVFLFGLVHGFGFASVLRELTGGGGNMIWSLLGFNLGVEAGQIAITLLVLPVLIWMRRYRWYAKAFVGSVSAMIAALGGYWVLTRI